MPTLYLATGVCAAVAGGAGLALDAVNLHVRSNTLHLKTQSPSHKTVWFSTSLCTCGLQPNGPST